MIPLANLQALHDDIREEIDQAVSGVIDRCDFILGDDVTQFEKEFALYNGTKHAIGVASGCDALILALHSIGVGPGDEVITQANTFVATALAITRLGATPVLVDHDPVTYTIDPGKLVHAISPRTRAIIPVHLYGHPADMDTINTIAREHGVHVIEDSAQAHGARYKGKRCGSLGNCPAFSFFPGKNLGAMGDGGAICTDDEELADTIRMTRNYGAKVKNNHVLAGFNSRLDTIHAAVLRIKLRRLDQWNERRRQVAENYRTQLASLPMEHPVSLADMEHVFHQYIIRTENRNLLLQHLHDNQIHAGLHYPRPVHFQPAFQNRCLVSGDVTNAESFADSLLSLPVCPYISDENQQEVIEQVHQFHEQYAWV